MKYAADYGYMQVQCARCQIKEAIVENTKDLFRLIYGDNPNFAEDEDYVLEWEAISKSCYTRVPIDVYDKFIDDSYVEHRLVETVIVTLDDNLFFVLEGDDSEVEWKEINVENLGVICDLITESVIHKTSN